MYGGVKQNLLLRDFRRLSLGVTAVHDEIKPERGRRPFLGHGVLFVPDDWLEPLTSSMLSIRKEHAYFDEIHWREIKGGSRRSKPFLVAKDWLVYYLKTAIGGCPFKAFIAEDGANRRFPYPGDFTYPEHLLLSTKTAFKGGIAWSFYRERKVRLRIVFDKTDSELDKSIARDLPALLQTEVNTRRLTGTKRYPWLRVEPVQFVSSDPKEASFDDWPLSELVQLCDLLLGASFQALRLVEEPDRMGRRRLARSILEVLGETIKVPWLQQLPVHRKFSVSLYPDRHNFAYPAALRLAPRTPEPPSVRLPGFEVGIRA